MDLLAVADFPHMKKEARSKLWSSLRKLVNKLESKSGNNTITNEDLAKILSGR